MGNGGNSGNSGNGGTPGSPTSHTREQIIEFESRFRRSPVVRIPPPPNGSSTSMTTVQGFEKRVLSGNEPHGIEKRPVIGQGVKPDVHGNGIMPPLTNLRGAPSAFQDDITATGGGLVIQTSDEEEAERPVTWAMKANQWLYDNRTSLLLGGIVIFAVTSVM